MPIKSNIKRGTQINAAQINWQSLRNRLTPFKKFRRLTLPHAYLGFQDFLIEASKHGNYVSIVKEYANEKQTIFKKQHELPSPNSQKWLQDRKISFSQNMSSQLKNAESFFNVASSAPEETQPIYFYYSFMQFSSFLTNTFLTFNNSSGRHGIEITFPNLNQLTDKELSDSELREKIENIQIKIQNDGNFQRLVDTLTILTLPSIFSLRILQCFPKGYSDIAVVLNWLFNDSNYTPLNYSQGIPYKFYQPLNSNFAYSSNQTYSFREICNFDVSSAMQEVGNLNNQKASIYLLAFLIVYTASNIARYRPFLWNSIIRGEVTDIYESILYAYDLYDDFIYDIYSSFFSVALGNIK